MTQMVWQASQLARLPGRGAGSKGTPFPTFGGIIQSLPRRPALLIKFLALMNLHHHHLRTVACSAAADAANTATQAATCFVYGTLMSPDVLQVLLGRIPPLAPSANLPNHSRHPVIGRVYPGVIPTPPSSSSSHSSSSSSSLDSSSSSNTVEGLLILDITPLEMKILDWFESEDYKRSTVQVLIPSNVNNIMDNIIPPKNDGADIGKHHSCGQVLIQTNTYIWSLGAEHLDTSCDWDYSAFLQNHLGWFLENTVGPCRSQIEKEILPATLVGDSKENCR